MVSSKHIWSPVIEKSDYKGSISPSNLLQSTKTNYDYYQDNTIIAPSSVEIGKGPGVTETRFRYHAYDNKGNILEVSKEKDIHTCYLWGYNQTLPIAKIENAQYFYGSSTNEINTPFYTSFEEDNSNVNTTYFRTGRKCHRGSFTFNLPMVTGGNNNYILTYWRKLSNASTWEYVMENVPITSLVSKTIGVGYAYIDEVRFYPEGSTMTTYTYDPLIGMTSSTDENNLTTTYDYDTFGRLKQVKDNKGNILKSYDYNYKH